MENKNTNLIWEIDEVIWWENITPSQIDIQDTFFYDLIQQENKWIVETQWEELITEPMNETIHTQVIEDTTQIITDNSSLSTEKETFLNELEGYKKQHEWKNEWQEKTSFMKKTLGYTLYFFRYILVSSFIFFIILWASNYNAYIEIAKSYFNPEILEKNKESLLASVNATQINQKTETETETGSVQEENTQSSSTVQTENTVWLNTSVNNKLNMIKNKTYHSMDKLMSMSSEQDPLLDIDMVPYENRIVIPKIGKNVPLIEVDGKMVQNVDELEKVFMEELVNGIIRYPWSAKPWQDGNAFIFWHSSNFPWMKWKYNDVFALIDNVTYGDEIISYYGQKKFVYKVTQKKIIKPWDVSILKKDDTKKEISLMTCWPVGTTLNRMIVVWELVEVK